MKKDELKNIIKEEIINILNESNSYKFGVDYGFGRDFNKNNDGMSRLYMTKEMGDNILDTSLKLKWIGFKPPLSVSVKKDNMKLNILAHLIKTKRGQELYVIGGLSGDYGFGGVPISSKHYIGKRATKEAYDKIIKKLKTY